MFRILYTSILIITLPLFLTNAIVISVITLFKELGKELKKVWTQPFPQEKETEE